MPRRHTNSLGRSPLLLLIIITTLAVCRAAEASEGKTLTLTPVASEPARTAAIPIAVLRKEVEAAPDDRTKRVALVRGLMLTKDLDGALAAAKSWRTKDAYNLVAVRALGDVQMERGENEQAERTYSAIVELLPRDPDAQ